MENQKNERQHKGIAKQIGFLKKEVKSIKKLSFTQFVAGIAIGWFISVATQYIFIYIGL